MQSGPPVSAPEREEEVPTSGTGSCFSDPRSGVPGPAREGQAGSAPPCACGSSPRCWVPAPGWAERLKLVLKARRKPARRRQAVREGWGRSELSSAQGLGGRALGSRVSAPTFWRGRGCAWRLLPIHLPRALQWPHRAPSPPNTPPCRLRLYPRLGHTTLQAPATAPRGLGECAGTPHPPQIHSKGGFN